MNKFRDEGYPIVDSSEEDTRYSVMRKHPPFFVSDLNDARDAHIVAAALARLVGGVWYIRKTTTSMSITTLGSYGEDEG